MGRHTPEELRCGPLQRNRISRGLAPFPHTPIHADRDERSSISTRRHAPRRLLSLVGAWRADRGRAGADQPARGDGAGRHRPRRQ